MKVTGTEAVIERTGATESKGFAIKASAQAFRILSDGLYSDKVKAVVRELSSNAWDAHIQAGTTDTPFLVHLPNDIEPWFSIRDYGIGLAHDKVMGLYSTYFDSTKDESNDFTGAMGLGSKSPFSYTDAFTVTSYYNGEKRVYMIDIGSEGVPSISLVGSGGFATDEHNGLEIKMAVKQDDFYTFREKAKDVYRWYPLMPKVVGIANFTINKVEYTFEGEGWKLIKTDNYTRMSYAVQGTVAYPIKGSNLQGADYELRTLINCLSVQIDFDIGELEVSASREDLGYDERTSKNIIAKINIIVEELTKQATDRLAVCETLWEARIAFKKLKADPMLKRLFDSNIIKPEWEGIALANNLYARIVSSNDKVWGEYQTVYSSTNRIMRRYGPGLKHTTTSVEADEDAILAINDTKTSGVRRFRQYANANIKGRSTKAIMFTIATTEALDELREELGVAADYEFLLTSNMPKPVNAPRAANTSLPELVQLGKFEQWASSPARSWRDHREVDVTEGGIFVQTYQGRPDSDSYDFKITQNMDAIVEAAKDFKLIGNYTTIYGVPRTKASKVRKNGVDCKDLIKMVYDYINNEKDALTSKIGLVADQEALEHSFYDDSKNRVELFKQIATAAKKDNLSIPKDVETFIDNLGDGVVDVQYIKKFKAAASHFNIDLGTTTSNSKVLRDKHDALLEAYPMIKHMSTYGVSHDMLVDIIAYINN
jgi:hypothetical protein